MNVLITGCAGFIGYSLIEELIKKNKYKITGVDNLNNINNDLKIKKKYIKLQLGDILKTAASTKKINKFVGKYKKINISQGINAFVKWYKSYDK